MIWFGFEYLKKYAVRFDFRIICNSHTLIITRTEAAMGTQIHAQTQDSEYVKAVYKLVTI